MTLTEIENLALSDLKAKREEIVKELGGGELAQRYVQARTDAKMRDEKLAEQGKTIEALQAGHAALAEALAKARRTALATVLKTISPALAAE